VLELAFLTAEQACESQNTGTHKTQAALMKCSLYLLGDIQPVGLQGF